jgi:hypothetical protein
MLPTIAAPSSPGYAYLMAKYFNAVPVFDDIFDMGMHATINKLLYELFHHMIHAIPSLIYANTHDWIVPLHTGLYKLFRFNNTAIYFAILHWDKITKLANSSRTTDNSASLTIL